MVKYVSEDREYSRAIRESIVESDVQTFVELRGIVGHVRNTYVQLYDFVANNWDRFGRPAVGQSAYNMHG